MNETGTLQLQWQVTSGESAVSAISKCTDRDMGMLTEQFCKVCSDRSTSTIVGNRVFSNRRNQVPRVGETGDYSIGVSTDLESCAVLGA